MNDDSHSASFGGNQWGQLGGMVKKNIRLFSSISFAALNHTSQ
jgi:hypothetical protein